MKEYRSFETLKYALAVAAEQGADSYRVARKGPGESGKPAWGPIHSITEFPPISPSDGQGPIKVRLLKEEEPVFQDIYILATGEDSPGEIPKLKPQVVKQPQKKPQQKPVKEKSAHVQANAGEAIQEEGTNGHGNGHGTAASKAPGLGTLIQEALTLASALSQKTEQMTKEQVAILADQQRLNELLAEVRDRSPALVALLS